MIALKIPANGHRFECIAKPTILQAWGNIDGKTVLYVSQLTFHLLSKFKHVTQLRKQTQFASRCCCDVDRRIL